nr:reverse transcriptase domain-containing protein [Tanacetum cinerariifolium]
MRTRSRSRHKIAEPLRIEFHSQEDQFQEDPPEASMADNQTMAQLLQAPTVGYDYAIVIPEIAATNFELKHGLINLVQNKQFFGHNKEDPHAHIRYFNKITSTMRVPNVLNSTIKLLLFPFSLEGAARIWLEKEPPRSILTWDDLVSKFKNQSFLKTGRALIDVFQGELTLRVGKEAITFNLDQTSRYLANYNDMTVNRIDIIDMACEEYSQEVLGFSNVIASGNPTPYYDLIIYTFFPTLTPFGDSDFLFEEVDAFLAFEDDPTLLEDYLPQVRKELKIYETKTDKSSIDEPPKVELKDLPSHLEYAFLEDDDKLPGIIAKDLSDEDKTALITVLKSHKRAIAWKLSDINGINPEFYTHKILMEEDFKPAVQYQRRVNPKIHDVIKKEVLKLLDAGLIYTISDSPWVSPVHCVPKKGGFTVVKNEENELIPTRLVTGWRVCIDYRKLNEATRKDHFPLPFMDQMLERLVGNEYYCFLDGFLGYF